MDIYEYLTAHEDRFVQELKELLRLPSVSAQSEHAADVAHCAEWLKAHLTGLGFAVDIHPTAGHPVVLASRRNRPDKPTVLVYGHYDVQPVDPLELWESGPFEPTIRGEHLYARGATDDKGQLFTHLKAAEAWLATAGELPVNLIILLEGEEEVGSDNLGPFLSEHAEELKADYCVISDTSQFAPGVPGITYGLRGILCFELHLRGARSDLHSGGYGGVAPNPLHAAVELLAGMRDARGVVTIPGFYDDVRPLEAWERRQWAALPFDPLAYREELDVPALAGEEGYTVLERLWARPTLEINGLAGGYAGEGFKTVLPAEAVAKVSMRLVPDQDPRLLAEMFINYVERHLPRGVRCRVSSKHAGKPILVPVDSPGMQAARRAIARGFGTEPVLMREGGSIPIVNTFREVLGLDCLLLGWGQQSDRAHAPNERLALKDFHAGTRSAAALLGALAEVAPQAAND
jgi:acetylornithine deacetylase/succinyl-diaminopimelate desuccinylase-like protein